MRRALAGAAVLLSCAGLTACGGDSTRDRVADYVKQANQVQESAAPAFRRANRGYVRFARGTLPTGRAPRELAAAERTIAAARRRLAALEPPAPARALHRDLLRVFDLDLGLAHETTQLARYAPARARAVRPLAGAARGLARGLGRSAAPADQAAVLARYARRIGGVVRRLRPLRPPPVTAAAHRALVRRLDSTARLANRLRRAVARRDNRVAARLLVAFRRVTSSSTGSRGVTRAAVAAYGRRRLAIGHAVAAANRELARLDRTTS
jgi:hypothetical protein